MFKMSSLSTGHCHVGRNCIELLDLEIGDTTLCGSSSSSKAASRGCACRCVLVSLRESTVAFLAEDSDSTWTAMQQLARSNDKTPRTSSRSSEFVIILNRHLHFQSSGVKVSQECLDKFQELKLGKKIKYIIYSLNDKNTEIIVQNTSTSTSYDDFLAELPPTECRYAIYDFEYEKGDAGKRNKICFFSWSPDDARIKPKMVFASSKDALRKALVGISAEIQGTDFSEVSYDTVLDKVSRSTF
ncbi:hypothetical protein PHSY_003363 [Pseudozyma hubeiensis SY62]|uniref:Cofilin n=1 Tax=Pseudozyma hubeiensis (strain SY62) TaxID=1305764 RepID=R9P3G1_PSEHS|nr:hypothetical protein PHSY_003363 [Pseudozyma hubeiensis SY62]GAC95787.1 hypothetical protein PHSY_003363 [Pseudozyma hubeiensis SY62]